MSRPPPTPPRAPAPTAPSAPGLGIALILLGILFISINDMVIKHLSDAYPLHQMVFVRSAIGIAIALAILRFEGGFALLRTRRPGLHAVRALLIVLANMAFFAGISVMPLGAATAIFFVAPLLITLLSIPILGERVGPRRIAAVIVGFLGVLVMTWPGGDAVAAGLGWAAALPLFAALCYAGMQVLTRKLGAESRASAMSIYIHVAFLSVSSVFYLAAGDGRHVATVEAEALVVLVRPWVWPAGDLWLFGLIGVLGGVIGYALSQAYRVGDPATIAPFEYVALPLAVFWGWLVFAEVPTPRMGLGVALIAGAGLYVFLRERKGLAKPPPPPRPGARR